MASVTGGGDGDRAMVEPGGCIHQDAVGIDFSSPFIGGLTMCS